MVQCVYIWFSIGKRTEVFFYSGKSWYGKNCKYAKKVFPLAMGIFLPVELHLAFFFYIMFFAISCFASLKKNHFESIFFTMAHLCYMIMGKFLPFDWQANRLNQRDMTHRSVFCDRFKLCSTAALDCRTGQNKSRYRKQELSFLLVLLNFSSRRWQKNCYSQVSKLSHIIFCQSKENEL